MTALNQALETSVLLAEKIASARPPSATLLERAALADFAAFGMFKRAAIDPAAMSALQRGLGWGVGLGIPALGVGHLLARDAGNQGHELLRDARNQALMTAAGVGGMQGLGELLKSKLSRPSPATNDDMAGALSSPQKLAAAILVDDVLEAACALSDPDAKHAALVLLVRHRGDGARLLRSLLP
jgi:hypothetical protein